MRNFFERSSFQWAHNLNISLTTALDTVADLFWLISPIVNYSYLSFLANKAGSIVLIWIWAISLMLKYFAYCGLIWTAIVNEGIANVP